MTLTTVSTTVLYCDEVLATEHMTYSRVSFSDLAASDIQWHEASHGVLTITAPHLRCDVGLEEGNIEKNCLCYSIMYYNNGAQRYKQLQVGRL